MDQLYLRAREASRNPDYGWEQLRRLTMSANDYQPEGDHYRRVPGQQHWDRVVALYGWPGARPYFVGNITAYLERYHLKNGVRDLIKARHYLEKLIELEESHAQGAYSCGCPVQPVESWIVKEFCPVHLKPLEESHDPRRVHEASPTDRVQPDKEPSSIVEPDLLPDGPAAGYPTASCPSKSQPGRDSQ